MHTAISVCAEAIWLSIAATKSIYAHTHRRPMKDEEEEEGKHLFSPFIS